MAYQERDFLKNFSIPTYSSRLFKLTEGGSLYFALNLRSDPALIDKLQIGIEKLKRDGKRDAIVQRYTQSMH